jgi:farnesyl diphosphate synthase
VSFAAQIATDARLISQHFEKVLQDFPDLPLVQAMRYASGAGKRMRGFLVLESARLFGIAPENALSAAAAIEAMHAYSLVHDDLPAMDDDDLRRGLPTVHIKWDEATAILAGDALQSLAFEFLADPILGDGDLRLDLMESLAKAAGAQGMVMGQALDVAAETAKNPLNLQEITKLQTGKTCALICWSACAGARLARADLTYLAQYSQALGLAFQIQDDILDVSGDSILAGKRVGKDVRAQKATFVSLLGLNGARAMAAELVANAEAALAHYGHKAQKLIGAAHFVINRDT